MPAQAIIERVRARFANVKQISNSLAAVKHDGLRGRFREILAESLLLPYLPPTVELLTGTIIGVEGQSRVARNEDDIILYDQSWAPLLHRTRGRDAIIPITGVRAHIEVKSTLELSEIKDAVRAAMELNQLSIKTAPLGLLFAFDSKIGLDHHIPTLLLNSVSELGYQPVAGQTPSPIQGVCILGRGSWFLTGGQATNLATGWYEVKAEHDRELLAFISIVSNAMFGNERGLGTHVLDLKWLIGPNPPSAREIP